MIKKIIAAAGILLFTSFHLFAQDNPCTDTHIGKLVTKPLLKNGKIELKDAVKDSNDPRSASPDFTSTNSDSAGNIYIARHRGINTELGIDLLVVSNPKTGKCTYQVTRIAKTGIMGIRLDEDGDVTNWDEDTILTDEERQQETLLAKEWLTYFE